MSNSIAVEINTKTDVVNTDYDHIEIECQRVVLNTSATFVVRKYLKNDPNPPTFVGNAIYTMTGSDYTSWGTDDNYVKTWILTQMSATESA
jgi:hypothetical protein